MAALPGIESKDPALAEAVSAWLLESRMPLPPGLRLSLEVVEAIPEIEDPRTSYPQGSIEIRAGDPLGWVHIRWPNRAMARIEERRPEARILVTREAVRDLDPFLRGFLLIVLIFLWKRTGRFHIHAGTAIDPHGRGWMLIGHSQSGKSTTTALLAARGWRVGTDDIAFLTDCGERVGVLGFRDRIALRSGGHALLGKSGGTLLPRREKAGFWPEELGARWVQTVEPDFVVFTSLGGERTSFAPASSREILSGLIHRSVWVMFEPMGAQEHLDLLARLGRQARCFHATLAPDLFTESRTLEDFLP